MLYQLLHKLDAKLEQMAQVKRGERPIPMFGQED